MKAKFQLTLFAALLLGFTAIAQQNEEAESTGLPGENFSLEGALELFKKAESPEDFEKLLNTEDNYVNNLDLDEDGETDYVRVIDNMEDDVHAIVLQVPLSDDESQDIAVIELEKTGEEQAMLQIIGDEDVYGEQVIVEPYELESKDGGKGPQVTVARIVVNVWGWPSVRFVYRPGYRVWVSPWRYRHYPVWWKPWRPRPFNVFHPHVVRHRTHYHVVTTHRVTRAHRVYTPHRKSSTVVRSRTTVVKTRNGNVVGKKSTTRTTVKGRNGGQVTRKKTTTTRQPRGRRGN
jgi:hypothetical protein